MPARVSQFSLQVTLSKLVNRPGSRAHKVAANYDLTKFLGTAGSVRVSKSIREPAGAFSVSFADRITGSADSLYSLIEPMDMIEIRASRTATTGKLPLLMRGFVSEIRRSESVGAADGTPSRAVVIRGQDAGKLLQNNFILWQYAVSTGDEWVLTFAGLEQNGLAVQQLKVSDFMSQVINNVINPKIAALNVISSNKVKPFSIEATVPDGSVLPLMVGDPSGSIWDLMWRFADAPIWNELFVQDQEVGPVLIFRPRPSYSIEYQGELYNKPPGGAGAQVTSTGGSFLMPGASDPGSIGLSISEVLSLDISRSDAGVANFFWVDPGVNTFLTNGAAAAALLVSATDDTPSNDPKLYGRRLMNVGTHLSSDDDQVAYTATTSGTGAPIAGNLAFVKQRTNELAQLNQDNVLWEEGSIVARGSERFVPGQYITLNRGSTASTYYLTAVDHVISPLATWTTGMTVERGNGFYFNDQGSSGVAWREGRAGPYTTQAAAG